MRCLPIPVFDPPSIFLLFPSIYLSSSAFVYLISVTSVSQLGNVCLAQLGFPKVASASLSSWAYYPSVKLTSIYRLPQSLFCLNLLLPNTVGSPITFLRKDLAASYQPIFLHTPKLLQTNQITATPSLWALSLGRLAGKGQA